MRAGGGQDKTEEVAQVRDSPIFEKRSPTKSEIDLFLAKIGGLSSSILAFYGETHSSSDDGSRESRREKEIRPRPEEEEEEEEEEKEMENKQRGRKRRRKGENKENMSPVPLSLFACRSPLLLPPPFVFSQAKSR